VTAIGKGQKETTNAAERTAVFIADKMLIVTLEGLLGFVRIINLVIRLMILRFSGGGERERGDRPLRPSATAGYPATRCALKARRATAAPAG